MAVAGASTLRNASRMEAKLKAKVQELISRQSLRANAVAPLPATLLAAKSGRGGDDSADDQLKPEASEDGEEQHPSDAGPPAAGALAGPPADGANAQVPPAAGAAAGNGAVGGAAGGVAAGGPAVAQGNGGTPSGDGGADGWVWEEEEEGLDNYMEASYRILTQAPPPIPEIMSAAEAAAIARQAMNSDAPVPDAAAAAAPAAAAPTAAEAAAAAAAAAAATAAVVRRIRREGRGRSQAPGQRRHAACQ